MSSRRVGWGILPYDGGDNSPRQSQQSPFSMRGLSGFHTGSYSSYSGSSNSGTVELYNQVESRESRRHPVSYLGRSHGNIGGKFVHSKLKVDRLGVMQLLYRGGSTWREWQGRLAASSGFLSDITPKAEGLSFEGAQGLVTPHAPYSSKSELDAAGTTAIARVAPTNPLVDLSTSVAELLREGLPQVPGTAGNVGGEHLNIQFGYLPLYGDATDLHRVARDSDALIAQYERDSGRWIRRRYRFEDEVSVTTETRTNAVPAPIGTAASGLVSTGTLVTTRTTRTSTWFSGAFTYHLPRNGWRRSAAMLDHLYGIRPGVDTLWQLTGYSWLADYFTNIGDVMQNLTAFKQDGLVMPYGYIMRKRVCTHEETWSGPLYIGGQQRTGVASSVKTYTVHQRLPATPFGFGLELGDLSGRQLGILAALGISRL